MKVYAAMMDPRLPLGEVGGFAQRMEALGFDGIHIPEAIHDPFTVSTLVLEHTSRLIARTAVALAFTRSPMLTAYTAWDLTQFSHGRFELGLGTQIRPHIVERFAMPFDYPGERLSDYLAAIDACFRSFQSGETPDHHGEFYAITRLPPFFNPGASDLPAPPVWIGGVGPRTTKVAGERAAGFITHPTNSAPLYLDTVTLPMLETGLISANRARADLEVVAWSLCITGADDAELARQREVQRQPLAFTFSTPAYWPTLELYGWQDLGHELRRLTRAGAWDQLTDLLNDEVLDTLVPQATYDKLPAVIEAWFGNRISGIVLEPPANPRDDEAFKNMIADIQAATSATASGEL